MPAPLARTGLAANGQIQRFRGEAEEKVMHEEGAEFAPPERMKEVRVEERSIQEDTPLSSKTLRTIALAIRALTLAPTDRGGRA